MPLYARFTSIFIISKINFRKNILCLANLQVIAHETGHSIWELAFDNGNSPDCDRINQEYVIRGLMKVLRIY